jgi:hypothetical protein
MATIKDLKIGDRIFSVNEDMVSTELTVTDLSEIWMLQNEVPRLLSDDHLIFRDMPPIFCKD